MKRIISGLLFLCCVFASCSRNELTPKSTGVVEQDGNYIFHVEVSGESDRQQSYAAHPSSLAVPLNNLVMVIVDATDHRILDTAAMRRVSGDISGKYTFRIPSTIPLEKALFHVLANAYNESAKSDNLDLAAIEGSPFSKLLESKVAIQASKAVGVSPDSYLLMNRAGVSMDMLSKTLPPIRLQHLPARIYFDCSSLGGTVKQVRITNVSYTSSLQSLYPGAFAVEEREIHDLEDTDPQISPNRTDYYYLVYPSGKESTLHLNIEMRPGEAVQQKVVTLGSLESGKSYHVKINALGLSFQGNITELTVEPGNDAPVVLDVAPDLGAREVTWTSSNESIFTVTKDAAAQNKALVKGLQPGTATLTATCERASITLQVTVNPVI